MNSFPGGSSLAGGALGPAEREASIATLKGSAEPGKELDILIV
ncbi:MAG: glycerol-3-phosphate dehydrogenase, partial [Arthrobacter sp.]|nr:glycerol-3-phosphate dehydrogenase [Arthrobacter sp.]